MSSVSVISAASCATSVPAMPIATPMSAFFSAGASFTPSPVIATAWPRSLQRRHDAQLVGRRDARVDLDLVDAPVELGVVHRLQLGARDERRLAQHAELAGDRLRRRADGRR